MASRQTGGLLPSQRCLINQMLAPIPPTHAGPIVELGAGNGSLTRRLATRCPAARVLACEINPALASDTRKFIRRSGLAERVEVITDAAENLLARLGQSEDDKLQYVISGIPLGNLGPRRACRLIDAIHLVLAHGGLYVQFQHSLLTRRHIRQRFRSLRTVPVVLNLPPAVVYFARK